MYYATTPLFPKSTIRTIIERLGSKGIVCLKSPSPIELANLIIDRMGDDTEAPNVTRGAQSRGHESIPAIGWSAFPKCRATIWMRRTSGDQGVKRRPVAAL